MASTKAEEGTKIKKKHIIMMDSGIMEKDMDKANKE